MRQIAIVVIMVVLVGIAVIFVAQRYPTTETSVSDRSTRIVVTFHPLAEFAKGVGNDMVEVTSVVPVGTEPHDYEPTPKDISRIYASDLFLLNGAGMDAWAERLVPELERRGVKVVVTEDVVEVAGLSEEEVSEEGHEDEHAEEHSGVNPHFWLDPVLVRAEVTAIRDALVEEDVERREAYIQNAENYLAQLEELDRMYRTGLASCQKDVVITAHDAFAYPAERYGFEALAIAGLSPETEPSPRRLAEIASLARQEEVRYILFETLVSPRLAETLAREVGAETLVLNPFEGLTEEEMHAGENYFSVMRSNLQTLQTALECKPVAIP
jgi:zinc transport system substrate-binding protein